MKVISFNSNIQWATCLTIYLIWQIMLHFVFVFFHYYYFIIMQGGLAFLASRRNSRDSIKSIASNSSLFSNEDVGPLAFQASARGRQRRTSNFLELPGKLTITS